MNLLLLFQTPQIAADTAKPFIEYGIIGGVLLAMMFALFYMYREQIKERSNWVAADDKRLERWDKANERTTDALDQLSSLIKERISHS